MAAKTSKEFRSPRHWSLAQRLEHYIDKSGGPDACWPWTGTIDTCGYGRLRWDNSAKHAHRLTWIVTHGPVPVGLSVCHTCDNPPCCNPAHLWTDTHAANMADRNAKGRQGGGNGPGIGTPTAKLTDDQVRAIRAMRSTASLTQIAQQFGIHISNVSAICLRKTWRHI